MKKPELPRRSVSNFWSRRFRLCIGGCLCESCKREVDKKFSPWRTERPTSRYLLSALKWPWWYLIIVFGAPRPTAPDGAIIGLSDLSCLCMIMSWPVQEKKELRKPFRWPPRAACILALHLQVFATHRDKDFVSHFFKWRDNSVVSELIFVG